MVDPDVRAAMDELKKMRKEGKFGAQGMRARVMTRAKTKGLEFDLDREWFQERLDAGRCEVSGLPFEMPTERRFIPDNNPYDPMLASPWQPSVDKVDPKGGYTKDNCQMVCFAYNIVKNRFTDEDVLKLAHALVENNTTVTEVK